MANPTRRLALKRLAAPLLALLVASSLAAQEANRNVSFGLPGPAKPEPSSREAFLIARPQYVLSYNAEKKIPNWVAWELKASDIGSAARAPFEPDPDLPRGFARVTSRVYNGSGFDRGHQCPTKDRSSSPKDIRATFFMTNIVPQSPHSNQRGWERLEDYCRRLAREGHVLSIACGPAGVGGTGTNGRKEEIGEGRLRVTVPNKLWKVVLVLPREGAEPRKNTRVIAVVMPNDQTVDYDWAKYRVTARQVEKLTGLHFFPKVEEDVREALLDHLDKVEVRVPRSRGGKERD
jgi:endonuclease G, mitochondrial